MVNIQQDKLRALYFMWIDGKEKQFSELQAQAAAKLAEKDTHDYIRAELRQEVATLKLSCGKWQDKYIETREKKKATERLVREQAKEIEHLRAQTLREKRATRRALEEVKHLR